MAYALDLASAWAKLDRASVHIDELRAEIAEGGGDPNNIPLRHEYDDKERAVIWRVERVMEIRDDWPLIVGDAIHNPEGRARPPCLAIGDQVPQWRRAYR